MTKDDIMKLARKAGLFTHKEVQPELEAFYNRAVAAEREECARLVEEYPYWIGTNAQREIGAAIRARGNT